MSLVRTFRRGVAALLLAAGLCPAPGCQAATTPDSNSPAINRRNGALQVEIKLSLEKSRFLASEDLPVTVAVTNPGSTPLEIPDPFHSGNWQPVYTLKGTGLPPEGRTFSFRSVTTGDVRAEPDDVPPAMTTLAPGETREDAVPVHQWLEGLKPGSYQLSARLTWRGAAAEAAPVAFDVERPVLTAASFGVDERIPDRAGEWIDFLHRGPTGVRLFTGLFVEPKIDQHGFQNFSIAEVRPVGGDATDLLTAWSNYNRMADLPKWRAWREGATLHATAGAFAEPLTLDLGAVPQALARPALMTRDGALDVFVVAAGGRELQLVRFPAQPRGGVAAPTVLSRAPLPAGLTGVRVALAPGGASVERHVVVTWDERDSFLVGHLKFSAKGEAGLMAITRFPEAKSLPNSEPALRVEADGSARVSALCMTTKGGGAPRLAVVDLAVAPGDDAPVKSEIAESGALRFPPRAAAVSFVVSAGAAVRRDWVVLFDENRILNSRSTPELHRLDAPPALPLQLVTITDASYLLTLHPERGVEFTTQL